MNAYTQENACLWVEDEEYWETACGNKFILISDTPAGNGMKFCPYCGKYLYQMDAKHQSTK